VTPAPTRESVTSPAVTPEEKAATALEQSKTIASKRQGIFGNIRTTPLGDATYGGFSVARFGKRAA
jgi:hypothetical protein